MPDRRSIVSPLAATLERVSASGAGGLDLSARLGVPDEPGWASVAGLARDPGSLEEILSRIERGYGGGERAYAGTSLLRGYLWRFLTTTVAALLTERRLPDPSAENVALRFDGSGFAAGLAFVGPRFRALADDPDAGHPDAATVASEGDLLARLREALAETHLPAIVPALRGLRVRRGTRALRGAAVDTCAEAFLFVGRDLGREKEAEGFAGKLLGGPPPLSGPAKFTAPKRGWAPQKIRVRGVCCLYYKVGGETCLTCPRLSDEERRRRLAEG